MIKHNIAINKPFVITYAPPPAKTAFDKWTYRGVLIDQPTYEEYLQNSPIAVGNFVKFRHNTKPVENLYQVHYVLRVIKEHDKVPYLFDRGHPKNYTLLQCASATQNLWLRMDSAQDYVPISDEEYDRLIRPNYDNLQNSIKEHQQASPI